MDIFDIFSRSRDYFKVRTNCADDKYLRDMVNYFASHDMDYINNEMQNYYGCDFNSFINNNEYVLNAEYMKKMGHFKSKKVTYISRVKCWEVYLLAYMMPHLRDKIDRSVIEQVLRCKPHVRDFGIKDYIDVIDFDSLDNTGKLIYMLSTYYLYNPMEDKEVNIALKNIVKEKLSRIENFDEIQSFDPDNVYLFRKIMDYYKIADNTSKVESSRDSKVEKFLKLIELNKSKGTTKETIRNIARKNFTDIDEIFNENFDVAKSLLHYCISNFDKQNLNVSKIRENILNNPTINRDAKDTLGKTKTDRDLATNLVDLFSDIKVQEIKGKYYLLMMELGLLSLDDLYNHHNVFGKIFSNPKVVSAIPISIIENKNDDGKSILDFIKENCGYESKKDIVSALDRNVRNMEVVVNWNNGEGYINDKFWSKPMLSIKNIPLTMRKQYVQIADQYLSSDYLPALFCGLYNIKSCNPTYKPNQQLSYILSQLSIEDKEYKQKLEDKKARNSGSYFQAVQELYKGIDDDKWRVSDYINSRNRANLISTLNIIKKSENQSYTDKFIRGLVSTLRIAFVRLKYSETKDYDPTKVDAKLLAFMLNDFRENNDKISEFCRYYDKNLFEPYISLIREEKSEAELNTLKKTMHNIRIELAKYLNTKEIDLSNIEILDGDKLYKQQENDVDLAAFYLFAKGIYNCNYNLRYILRQVIMHRDEYQKFYDENRDIAQVDEININNLKSYFSKVNRIEKLKNEKLGLLKKNNNFGGDGK